MLAETITLPELAASLGRKEEWLRRNWLRFHRTQGFPRKLPGTWAWPRALVEAWARAGGFEPVPEAPPANDNASVDPEAAFLAAASQRYGVNLQ
jgi:hypothetical protein